MAKGGRQVFMAGSHGIVRRWDRKDGKWLEPLKVNHSTKN
jgi:hypothetical protein